MIIYLQGSFGSIVIFDVFTLFAPAFTFAFWWCIILHLRVVSLFIFLCHLVETFLFLVWHSLQSQSVRDVKLTEIIIRLNTFTQERMKLWKYFQLYLLPFSPNHDFSQDWYSQVHIWDGWRSNRFAINGEGGGWVFIYGEPRRMERVSLGVLEDWSISARVKRRRKRCTSTQSKNCWKFVLFSLIFWMHKAFR